MTSALMKWGASKAADKILGNEFEKYKHKKPAGNDDPYFEHVPTRKGGMKKVKKQVPDYIPAHDAKVLAKAKKRAYHLDMSLFNFMGIRFGWSSVIGIIPEIGDAIDGLMAYRVIKICEQIEGGLPPALHRKMMINLVLDVLVGLVPFIGDLADAYFRCNTKNVALLEKHLITKYAPSNMSKAEKRRSQLEPVAQEELHHYQSENRPPQPSQSYEPQAPPRTDTGMSKKSWGSWFGGRKPQYDPEVGRPGATFQETGQTAA